MKRLLLSRAGMTALCLVTLAMAFMLHRIANRARERDKVVQGLRPGATERKDPKATAQVPGQSGAGAKQTMGVQEGGQKSQGHGLAGDAASFGAAGKGPAAAFGTALQEELSFLDQGRALGSQSRKDRDRQGRTQTRRKTASGVGEGQSLAETREKKTAHLQLRLSGKALRGERGLAREKEEDTAQDTPGEGAGDTVHRTTGRSGTRVPSLGKTGSPASGREEEAGAEAGIEDLNTNEDGGDALSEGRFCPYGRPIRCELVFTIDSTMEETPLVALVMEPVYNNGHLVIPAGAELHGLARPDRLRDRIFSSREWVLLFPREEGLPNGRELRVRGLALDRAEPAADGLSWGITDGSNGLQGMVIRTLESEELKRFAAGFISAAALGLQEREAAGRNGSRSSNTPGNAALQGVASTMEDLARRISGEIERHGVFLRVPGGKQFYFYPRYHAPQAGMRAGAEGFQDMKTKANRHGGWALAVPLVSIILLHQGCTSPAPVAVRGSPRVHQGIIVLTEEQARGIGGSPATGRPPAGHERPPPPAPGASGEALLKPPLVRAYLVGRTRDPLDPRLLHEAHTVYRIEEDGDWELDPHAGNEAAADLSSDVPGKRGKKTGQDDPGSGRVPPEAAQKPHTQAR